MKVCQLCKKKNCKKIINFGNYPISHNFIKGKNINKKFPLELGQCQSCGLVQLMKLTPVKKLIPKYNWITHNEPEDHLDHLSNIISSLPNIHKSSKICGVSYKEDSLLKRLNKLGFKNTWRMDMKKDLSIFNKKSNLETIQNKINNRLANKINKTHGSQDVIIVRHILEHTHKTLEFMLALKNIIKKNGYIIFEVPDCSKGFKINDYNTLWEEHVLYFTDVTFKNSLKLQGFQFQYFKKYIYLFESVLIGIVQPDKGGDTSIFGLDLYPWKKTGSACKKGDLVSGRCVNTCNLTQGKGVISSSHDTPPGYSAQYSCKTHDYNFEGDNNCESQTTNDCNMQVVCSGQNMKQCDCANPPIYKKPSSCPFH